jgi:putative ABC transport system substrate-binding protein
VLWDPVTHERQLKAVEAGARGLGLEVQVLRATSESELEAAFEAARKARSEAMLVMISPTYVGKRSELVRLAAQYRIPAMYHSPAFTEVGGLIAYGPSLEEQWQKIAGTIDRVLKGARAAELPFQQPTRSSLTSSESGTRNRPRSATILAREPGDRVERVGRACASGLLWACQQAVKNDPRPGADRMKKLLESR